MFTQIISGESAFAELQPEWDALASKGMTDTPFQHFAYQQAWWSLLKPSHAQLHTLTARDTQGDLQAVACLYLDEGTLRFNGCVEETDYLDLIAPESAAEAAWKGILDCLEAGASLPWHSLELCNIPAASASRRVLRQLAQDRGYSFEETVAEVCPIIKLPDTFDAYLEQIDAKQRRELSRKLRRADAAAVEIEMLGPGDDVEAAVNDFLDLLQKSTFEKRDWLNDGRRALFHDVAREAQASGTLQLMFGTVEGQRAAALFNFDYGDRIWVYNSGLDPGLFSALSLGVVLTAKAIERAIALGRSEFDFLRGDEEYKYRFGAQDTHIYRLALSRPGAPDHV